MAARPIVRMLLILLVAALADAWPARATTVVPVPEHDLIRDAAAIVVGQVRSIESHWDPARRQVFTRVTLALDDVLKGEIAATEITLKQAGGTVGGIHAWIDGSPEFRRGERALLFLRTNQDGTLRVAHLFQGKFQIQADPVTGDETVHRDERPAGVNVLAPRSPASGEASREARRALATRPEGADPRRGAAGRGAARCPARDRGRRTLHHGHRDARGVHVPRLAVALVRAGQRRRDRHAHERGG
jgi:hypothetical protein